MFLEDFYVKNVCKSTGLSSHYMNWIERCVKIAGKCSFKGENFSIFGVGGIEIVKLLEFKYYTQ